MVYIRPILPYKNFSLANAGTSSFWNSFYVDKYDFLLKFFATFLSPYYFLHTQTIASTSCNVNSENCFLLSAFEPIIIILTSIPLVINCSVCQDLRPCFGFF